MEYCIWNIAVEYIYAMEYCSAIIWNKIVPFAEMWMDLETVIQSESKFEREKQIY